MILPEKSEAPSKKISLQLCDGAGKHWNEYRFYEFRIRVGENDQNLFLDNIMKSPLI